MKKSDVSEDPADTDTRSDESQCLNYSAAVIFILLISRKSREICLMGDTTLSFKNKSDFRWECPSVPPMKGYVQETGNIHTPHNLRTHTRLICL